MLDATALPVGLEAWRGDACCALVSGPVVVVPEPPPDPPPLAFRCERQVRFPAGRFAPLLSEGDVVEGPATVTVPAPLGEIPVYLRAGGIVPLTANTPMTLLEGVDGVEGLESTEGDREVYVGLGADGLFVEESGGRYQLVGTGTDKSGLATEADGAVLVDGNGRVEGGGFTLVLSGHPDGRVTRVHFR